MAALLMKPASTRHILEHRSRHKADEITGVLRLVAARAGLVFTGPGDTAVAGLGF
jgi:hypothetical protein